MTKNTFPKGYNAFWEVFFIVIYADILFIVNFFITLLLLRLTARLTKREVKTVRLVLASAAGGAYALIILVKLPEFLSPLLKGLSAAALVWIAFGFGRLKSYARAVLVYFFSSFIFLGIITALCYVFKSGQIAVNNDTVYFNLTARGLLLCAFVSYLLSCLMVRLYNKKLQSGAVYTLKVTQGEHTVTLLALTDTGNRLREPFSDAPVIVAKAQCIAPIFSEKSLRLIPAATVTSGSYLKAFKPDRVAVKTKNGERVLGTVYIAASDAMQDEGCSAVMNPEILSL